MTHHSTPPPRRFTLPLAAICLAAGLSLAATGARAQSEAYTSEPVDLFAGPSDEYPVVTELGPNVPVTVMGCVSDYSWCDVAMPGMRGWVYAGYLTYPYQGGYVPLEGYGAAIGLPIVTFSIGAYWGSFYRDRSWYGQREHWDHVPPPGYGGRPPGPPPAVRGGPPGGPGRPPMPQGAGGRPPGQPMNGGERVEAPRPPAGGGNQPRPMPQPGYEGRPGGAGPAPAQPGNHAPPPMQGGARPAGPGGQPMEHGREGQPQGGRPSGQGGGGNHDDRHQPN
ncbi:SH3 domain-containing protein [Paraburkholderia sp. J67]|uniref:SH3 domain-containing protein n=1 Tax=Paraburkholderia sp. J67 TaxID=2805435 RepID=UPI002ABD6BBE|nr:SH3 domain-containing protein [Paraburkholderia sp. J67]